MERIRQARARLGQLLHVAVESSVLFDQLAAMPRKDSVGPTTVALHRACSQLKEAHQLLPDLSQRTGAGEPEMVGLV